jgi:hypothetical protein
MLRRAALHPLARTRGPVEDPSGEFRRENEAGCLKARIAQASFPSWPGEDPAIQQEAPPP